MKGAMFTLFADCLARCALDRVCVIPVGGDKNIWRYINRVLVGITSVYTRFSADVCPLNTTKQPRAKTMDLEARTWRMQDVGNDILGNSRCVRSFVIQNIPDFDRPLMNSPGNIKIRRNIELKFRI